LDVPVERRTVRDLLEILDERHPGFKSAYIDVETGALDSRVQVLIKFPGGRTTPIGIFNNLDTKLVADSRVVFM